MIAFCLILLLACVNSKWIQSGRVNLHEARLNAWQLKNNKQYTTQEEYKIRFHNFIETTKRVNQQNLRSQQLNSTATFAINKFADLSPKEFSTLLGMKGFKASPMK